MSTLRSVWITGLLLAGLLLAIVSIAPLFSYGAPLTASSAFSFVALMMAAGVTSLVLVRLLPQAEISRRQFAGMLLLGAIFRLMFVSSTPIYEDDWYRYLWDGAVSAQGISPYRYAPADVFDLGLVPAGELPEDPDLNALKALDAAQEQWPERVNYPYLTTIYPPVTQLAAWMANRIAAFDLNAWRGVLFVFDAAGLALLLLLLRNLQRRASWALLYWWNPLLIVATYNAAHMDILLVPCLLGATLLIMRRRPFAAAGALAAAVGVKLWPLILAPALYLRWLGKPVTLFSAIAVLLLLSGAMLAPMVPELLYGRSGLAVYSTSWERFSFLFAMLRHALSLVTEQNDSLARSVTGLAVIGVAGLAAYRVRETPERIPAALLLISGTLFFLSPTGYPWYAIWLIAFLPCAPIYGIAALSATLPLYYTRYYLDSVGYDWIFQTILTPTAFAVPLVILFLEMRRRVTTPPAC